MAGPELCIDQSDETGLPEFKRFALKDRKLFEKYANEFNPVSCEYSFTNLFIWQDLYKISWALYKDRILIYDAEQKALQKPFGTPFCFQDIKCLSVKMRAAGFSPDISLVSIQDIENYPQIDQFYKAKEMRDNAEYIYDVNTLVELKGTKLHKKRNLISQFQRLFPGYEIQKMKGVHKKGAQELAMRLMKERKDASKTLKQEYAAMQSAFKSYDQLGIEGIVLILEGKVIAFSMFSRLNRTTYDIHFEKSDTSYKGAAQLINQATAQYLKDRCKYLNREQDLGIKGLRQAKLSYSPKKIFLPYTLKYIPG